MLILFQIKQSAEALWRTPSGAAELEVDVECLDLLRNSRRNIPVIEELVCCDNNWEASLKNLRELSDVGCLTICDLFLEDLTTLPFYSLESLLRLLPQTYVWCASYGLENVRIVFGFNKFEIRRMKR